jgi:hypothetical protein
MSGTQTKPPIRIGFDLDGVLLYNPLCVMRPFSQKFSQFAQHSKTPKFYVPKNPFTQFIWKLIHYSSLYPAVRVHDFVSWRDSLPIETYVITARFRCLKGQFDRWKKQYKAHLAFTHCYQNLQDEQPHEFKAKMINQLNIKYYVEDNWGIVDYLTKHTEATVLWVTNPLDKTFIEYTYRFDTLKEALDWISEKERTTL